MRKVIFTVALVMTVIVSNAQNKHNIVQSQARMKETQFAVVTAPIIGELDAVSPNKITDSMEFYIGGFKDAVKDIVPNLDEYKKYTIANYCQRKGYDVIINPLFQLRTNEQGDKLRVIVTGYPAKYKSFRPAKEEDAWMMYFMNDNLTDDRAKKIIDNE